MPRWLELQADIDYLYYVLGQIMEKHEKNIPKSGLEIMIDESTGYDKKRINDFEKEIMPVCKRIKKLKKQFYKITSQL